MEKEIPILCLIYLERFTKKTGMLINYSNWKRLTLITLVLASKIWDDDSLENVHFPQVMSDVTLKEISGLEQVFLRLIDFDLVIRGAEYAKFYFVLKTFSKDFNSVLPMGPLGIDTMRDLQNNTVKAESRLREKYQQKLQLEMTI
jgi:Cyclin